MTRISLSLCVLVFLFSLLGIIYFFFPEKGNAQSPGQFITDQNSANFSGDRVEINHGDQLPLTLYGFNQNEKYRIEVGNDGSDDKYLQYNILYTPSNKCSPAAFRESEPNKNQQALNITGCTIDENFGFVTITANFDTNILPADEGKEYTLKIKAGESGNDERDKITIHVTNSPKAPPTLTINGKSSVIAASNQELKFTVTSCSNIKSQNDNPKVSINIKKDNDIIKTLTAEISWGKTGIFQSAEVAETAQNIGLNAGLLSIYTVQGVCTSNNSEPAFTQTVNLSIDDSVPSIGGLPKTMEPSQLEPVEFTIDNCRAPMELRLNGNRINEELQGLTPSGITRVSDNVVSVLIPESFFSISGQEAYTIDATCGGRNATPQYVYVKYNTENGSWIKLLTSDGKEATHAPAEDPLTIVVGGIKDEGCYYVRIRTPQGEFLNGDGTAQCVDEKDLDDRPYISASEAWVDDEIITIGTFIPETPGLYDAYLEKVIKDNSYKTTGRWFAKGLGALTGATGFFLGPWVGVPTTGIGLYIGDRIGDYIAGADDDVVSATAICVGMTDGEDEACSNAIPTPTPQLPPCSTPIDTENGGGCEKVSTSLGVSFETTPEGFLRSLLGVLLSISGAIALILIIYSGYRMMTSNGNPETIQAARETLTSAIVGLLFIIFSLVIIQVIGVDILQLPGFGN